MFKVCSGVIVKACLAMNVKYKFLIMKFVQTKFEKSIFVDLEEPEACSQPVDNTFFVFLPERWDAVFAEEQLTSV